MGLAPLKAQDAFNASRAMPMWNSCALFISPFFKPFVMPSCLQNHRRGLVFDRDGTLIVHVPYLCDPAQVVLLPGVSKALRKAKDAGVKLFVHSNQSGVGRGLFGLAEVEACNARMIELLCLGPVPFARICIAPTAPSEPAVYRKPSPRFAIELMRDYGFLPSHLAYIGDRGSDMQAAWQAGVKGFGVTTGLDDLQAELINLQLDGVFPVFGSLAEAVDHFLALPH
jgi:D-glycero-D-manno-heptose 1,7-bisphosphate phosphatase